MSPWALIPWAISGAISLLILTGPIALLAFLINMSRGKI